MLVVWAVGRPGQEPRAPPTTVRGSSETLGAQTWEMEPRELGEKGKEMNILNIVPDHGVGGRKNSQLPS